MKPYWVSKTDPEHYPVRYLAGICEQRTGIRLTPKQMGQLRDLRKALSHFDLDDLTQYVVEWILNPVNWWRFSQQVRDEGKLYRVPPDPDIGFLLWQRNRALRIMREELRNSTAPADISFCTRLDQFHYEGFKAFVVTFSQDNPERLARIEDAKTLTDIQLVFIEIMGESTAAST